MEDNMKKHKNPTVVLSMTALALAISTQVNAAPTPSQLSATNQQIEQQSP
ncbi:MAG: serine protease, partial [Cellvibrionaceae bacterium]